MNTLPEAILRIPVLTPQVLVPTFALTTIILVLLLVRRIPRWPVEAVAAAAVGAGIGGVLLWLGEGRLDLVGGALAWATRAWVLGCFAALALAAANLRRSTGRRKVGAMLGALVVLAATSLGINAAYAMNPTLGSIVGVTTEPPLALPPRPGPGTAPSTAAGRASSAPLWATWTPSTAMPSTGTTGTADIPGAISGFAARPAGLYLPPAALVTNPPALPLVVLMMGQPGNPDPTIVSGVLNRYSARHHGLAPIVIVADQLGNPATDTLCLDTPQYGKVETYINVDVIAWAKTHLNISTERTQRSIAGYSHGGQCAISFAAKHPDLWGNVLDVSGEEYPGAEHSAHTRAEVFGGDQAAYDAQKPANLLRGRHQLDTTAIFTISTDDPTFQPGAKRVAEAAAGAGMQVHYLELTKVGHLVEALTAGLDKGFAVLYPRLGLSRP